jgi:hypothetical protein
MIVFPFFLIGRSAAGSLELSTIQKLMQVAVEAPCALANSDVY